MRIAVIEHVDSGDYAEYISSLLNEMAREHNFQIKSWNNSVPASQQEISTDALIYIYIESMSPVLLNWLYRVKIPSILKKTRAQIVVDLNGVASAKITLPQVICIAQSFFYKDEKLLNGIEKFASRQLVESSAIAKSIVYSKQRAEKLPKINAQLKQAVPFSSPDIFRKFEWHEKMMVKAQHAGNNEFFIAVIDDNAVHDFVLLLQAFTKFKKWQQSSMRLMVLPKYETLSEEIVERHKTYKYRDDVILLHDADEKLVADIVASAYAFIHIAPLAPDLLALATALKCSLPVISFEDEDVKEYAGEAVLFASEKTPAALGEIIIKLYKDENLQAQLKEKAQQQSVLLARKQCADNLWQLIESAGSKK
jgi:glycosyltransferase involved in cell wall biosynthesis